MLGREEPQKAFYSFKWWILMLVSVFITVYSLRTSGVVFTLLNIVGSATAAVMFISEDAPLGGIYIFAPNIVSVICRLKLGIFTPLFFIFCMRPAMRIFAFASGYSIAVRFRMRLSSTIALMAFLGVAAYFALMLTYVKADFGRIDIASIRETVSAVSRVFVRDIKDTNGIFKLGNAELESLAVSMNQLFIGIIGVEMLIEAYLTTLAARVIAAVFGYSKLLPVEEHEEIEYVPIQIDENDEIGLDVFVERIKYRWRIELSTVTAAVAAIAYGFVMLFGGNDSLIAVIAAKNILLLICPGLVYVGIRAALGSITGKGRSFFGLKFKIRPGGIMVLLLTVMLLFINRFGVIMILAANGIIDIFSESFRRKDVLRYKDASNDRKE